MRFLLALPAYNEATHLPGVLAAVRPHAKDILVVDDGSTDGTADSLRRTENIRVITHSTNQGYGASLREAFRFARRKHYEAILTMDVDRQHEPEFIPTFVAALPGADVVSGSRYRTNLPGDSQPPADRRAINAEFTALLRKRLGLPITDAFCGFKLYGPRALKLLRPREPGYGMPLELWFQIAHHCLTVREVAVPRIYLPTRRAFGGPLDNTATRRRYYHDVFERAFRRWPVQPPNRRSPS